MGKEIEARGRRRRRRRGKEGVKKEEEEGEKRKGVYVVKYCGVCYNTMEIATCECHMYCEY